MLIRKTVVLFTILLGASSLFSSCQRESSDITTGEVTNERSDEIVRSLKFAPVTKETELRAGAHLGIVRLTLGRASRNCFGFGICDAEWFPGWSEWWDEITSSHKEASIEGLLVVDEYGREAIELKLAELPKGFSPEELSMMVDKKLEMPNSGENAFNPGKIVEKGVYEFSEEVGNFGGYRIPIVNDSL